MKKRYIDGYVLVVPKKNLKKYKKMATDAAKVWIKCGALQYVECVGDDMKSAEKMGCLSFPKMTKLKPGETVMFSYVVYKSKAHRDRTNAKVFKEMDNFSDKSKEECKKVFDMKKMAFGGFETIVNY